MAWIHVDMKSECLKMPVELELLVPQEKCGDRGYRVLFLLHDKGGDRTEWLLRTQLYDLVAGKPLLVCMPSGRNSFFINTENGYDTMDFVAKELPAFLKTMFRISDKKEDWLIAGASMGGYGALACGLHFPGQFGKVASMSGVLDVVSSQAQWDIADKELVFGTDREKLESSSYNLWRFCHSVPKADRPELFLCCGKQDDLYDTNKRFYEEIKEAYTVEWQDGEGGHDFTYWNESLKAMLVWFLERGKRA